jgi:hypothetical protein
MYKVTDIFPFIYFSTDKGNTREVAALAASGLSLFPAASLCYMH